MNNNKNKIVLYLGIAIFGVVGIYLTFIAGNINKYDSKIRAYEIYPNESYDSDDGTTYQPIYYFKVNGNNYECEAKIGSSAYPNEKKNMVYYDSSDPTKCTTEYEKSTSKFAGIVCLIVSALIIYFFIIRKPSINAEEYNVPSNDIESQNSYDTENTEKVLQIVERFQLIYKRVILGIIIIILLVVTLIDTMLFKQTIKAQNYIETVATYTDNKDSEESELFDDYIYVFIDKEGNQQEIIKSLPKDGSITPKSEITIKYNENDPQDYYDEGSTLDKSGMIWYIVKVVALILLIFLFFNKKLLNKINISASSNRD